MSDRYSRRNRFGDRFSEREGGNERGRYPEHTRGYGSENFAGGDRSDNYFGAGRQGFGDGLPADDFGNFGSAWRSSGSYGRMDRDESNSRGRYERDRDMSERDAYRGGYGRESFDRDRFGRNFSSDRPGSHGDTRDYTRGSYGSGPFNDYERGGRDDRGWWDKASDEVSSWFGDEEAERRRQMDDARSGSHHYGRGPKNYKRSDERIKEDINDRLTDDYAIDASDIEVEVSGGDVVLSGTVNSRYEKRAAEDVAERVSGVKNVENRIRVNDHRSDTFAPVGNTFEQDTSSGGLSGSTGENRSSSANGGI